MTQTLGVLGNLRESISVGHLVAQLETHGTHSGWPPAISPWAAAENGPQSGARRTATKRDMWIEASIRVDHRLGEE
jgi:hypothetical protein